MRQTNKFLLSAILLLGVEYSAFACSACGCSMSPGWESQGFTSASGLMIDLREDYINQSELRSGTHLVNDSDKTLPNSREIEQYTKQYYTTLSIDYKTETPFGFNIALPYVNRSHATVGAGDTDLTYSHTKSIGDFRAVGRYQIDGEDSTWGVRFGLKLPTGSYTDLFSSGAGAGGVLDRGLQPGTGTTDLILGVYRFAELNEYFDYFTQVGYKRALNMRDQYKPGNQYNGDVGIRWIGLNKFTPQLNINAKYDQRESGDQAVPADSGGKIVYVSPGVTADLSTHLKIYTFIQLPLYQNVNGFQLAPRWTGTVGLNYRF